MQEKYESRKENLLKAVNRQNPSAIPILANTAQGVVAYANTTYTEAIESVDKFVPAMTKIFDDLYTDSYINMNAYVYPKTAKDMRGLAQMYIGPDGITVEHVARPMMQAEDYPAFIADPDGFRKNVLLPRMFPFLFEEGLEKAKACMERYYEEVLYMEMLNGSVDEVLKEKYGLISIISSVCPLGSPLDTIFDYYRGFKETTLDLRRNKKQLKDACEAVWAGMDPLEEMAEIFPFVGQAPHIPTYLNPKQFQEFYWPYEKTIIENVHRNGGKCIIMTEGKWMHLFDFFREVPKDSCIFMIDDDDIFEAYDKIGDWQCIAGGAKLAKLMMQSKQENIDFAKRVIDYCAPGGGFIFTTDKAWNSPSDISQNLVDVYNFAHEYGVYR